MITANTVEKKQNTKSSHPNEPKGGFTAKVQAALDLQDKVIAQAVALGHHDPLDPKAVYNQIPALQDDTYFLPIVGFEYLAENEIAIDQVTAEQLCLDRVSTLKAEFEKIRTENPGQPQVKAPPIVKLRNAARKMLSGHNRSSSFWELNSGKKLGCFLVGEVMRWDGKPMTKEEKQEAEFDFAVQANPQTTNRQYTKKDCAKIIYDYCLKIFNHDKPTREQFEKYMDRKLPHSFPGKSDRTSIFNELQRLNGTYTILSVKAKEIADAVVSCSFSDPRPLTKTTKKPGKKLRSIRDGNALIVNNRTGLETLFLSTDDAGTHLDNELGVLIHDFNKDPENGTFAKQVKDAISRNNKLLKSQGKPLRNTLPAVQHMKIANPNEDFNYLEQQRKDTKPRIKVANVVLKNSKVPVVIEDIVCAKQLDQANDKTVRYSVVEVIN